MKSTAVAPCGPSLSTVWISAVVAVSAIISSICRCANASPDGNALASPLSTFESSEEEVEGPGSPEEWTTLTLSFADIGRSHTMAMRDSADEAEVYLPVWPSGYALVYPAQEDKDMHGVPTPVRFMQQL